MLMSDKLNQEINRVILNGGESTSTFSKGAIRTDADVLEEGMVFVVTGNVMREPLPGSDRMIEFKFAKAYRLDDEGEIVGEPAVIRFYPSFLTKRLLEVDDKCKLTGKRFASTGDVVDAFKSDPSGEIGTAFENHVEGRVIEVTKVTPVNTLRYGTRDQMYVGKVYEFTYSDVELPKEDVTPKAKK